MREWYKLDKHDISTDLAVDLDRGLSSDESKARLIDHGPNELVEEAKKSFISKLMAQFLDFLVLILIAAALISVFIGEPKDALVIIAIVILNALLGLYQEGKAEKALEALKKMASPTAKVLRDGQLVEAPANSLVPGDIVNLDAGDIIPADLRLIESSNLQIEEASLTGESVPVDKRDDIIYWEDVSLGDRKNMAYMSTFVTYGRGRGIVVETGHNTEIGKIATMIQTYENELTPLQNQLNHLGKVLGLTTIAICALAFGIGLIQGREVLEMFMVSISLAVAAIPEGLPAIVTIVLAIGMNKMVKKHAIVKKLLAVETLGSTTVICTDKTGTLTQNEMTVIKLYTDGITIDVTGVGYGPQGDFRIANKSLNNVEFIHRLLNIAVLSNDADLEKSPDGYKVIGDPTEGALITLGAKGSILKSAANEKYPRISEIPFDSDRKMMTTFHENFIRDKITSLTKGAPDIVIDRCSFIELDGKVFDFTDDIKRQVISVIEEFSKEALRVLAFSYGQYSELPEVISPDTCETNMVFVGLAGMIDPPRSEAKEAINKCKKAGIKTVMITGDHRETAFAIAKDLKLASSITETMTGDELNKISDEVLRETVKNIKVFARVSPEHKVRIVDALKNNGEITAMTGDGVNDALALKRADIGVSMGITGTDVAKNTAEMILTDDNFASIVSAVEEGRIIYSNIKKFVFFLLSCNIGEILLVFSSILLNLPIPLLAIQLLWLNLVTDSFPALALGVEKGEVDIMDNPPRRSKEPILDKSMLRGIAFQSIAIAAVSLFSYKWGLNKYLGDLLKARTIIFATLISAELLRAFSSRSHKHSLFEIGLFSNITMIYAVIASFALLLMVIYIPFFQPIFHTVPLVLTDWAVILGLSLIPLIVGESGKILFR
ncbi:MAG: calcium-translocating P-type ATPase, SERCA-type [Tissierellaceae bacterium]|nr:calcium-translocating P-type ATPase, SERCA-type [Tissierellaceae bacterium]